MPWRLFERGDAIELQTILSEPKGREVRQVIRRRERQKALFEDPATTNLEPPKLRQGALFCEADRARRAECLVVQQRQVAQTRGEGAIEQALEHAPQGWEFEEAAKMQLAEARRRIDNSAEGEEE